MHQKHQNHRSTLATTIHTFFPSLPKRGDRGVSSRTLKNEKTAIRMSRKSESRVPCRTSLWLGFILKKLILKFVAGVHLGSGTSFSPDKGGNTKEG